MLSSLRLSRDDGFLGKHLKNLYVDGFRVRSRVRIKGLHTNFQGVHSDFVLFLLLVLTQVGWTLQGGQSCQEKYR